MDMPHVKPAELFEVIHVAENIRQEDKEELEALYGEDVDIKLLLAESWKTSTKAYSIIHKGKAVGCFGVAPISGKWGSPWLLATDGLPKIAKEFIKQCPYFVEQLHSDFPNLMNLVHSNNKKAITWLKYLGFTILPIEEINNSYFHPFIKTKRYT